MDEREKLKSCGLCARCIVVNRDGLVLVKDCGGLDAE